MYTKLNKALIFLIRFFFEEVEPMTNSRLAFYLRWVIINGELSSVKELSTNGGWSLLDKDPDSLFRKWHKLHEFWNF